MAKISGPLLDRIDIHIDMPALKYRELHGDAGGETSLAAKGKCTIDVTFKPTATGDRTGSLSVSNSASNSPETSQLNGTGK